MRRPSVTRRRRPSPALRAAVRTTATAILAASIAVPALRRRLGVHPAVTSAWAASGPFALAVLRPRTKGRDAVLFALQMWAFTMVHEIPYDDPERLRQRLRIRYPILTDRTLGLGDLPTARLQRALGRPGEITLLDRALTWVHWLWFVEPHLSLAWTLVWRDEHFARAARQMAATYDLGCAIYFMVPTAPPWWAAENGYLEERVEAEVGAELVDDAGEAPIRRMMFEVGERVWGRAWPVLYDSLGGNPWAAMPSLHFATSAMAAILLWEASPAAGIVGWGYAAALGLALVYMAEHYLTDLLAGAALVALVRRGEPLAEPFALRVSEAVQRLERVANG